MAVILTSWLERIGMSAYRDAFVGAGFEDISAVEALDATVLRWRVSQPIVVVDFCGGDCLHARPGLCCRP